MYQNLKIYRCGDYIKLISIKLKGETKGEVITSKKSNDVKLKNNLIRAKNNIQDIALSNDFKYFFTLTFNCKYDRFDLSKLRDNFRRVVSSLRLSDLDLKYLIVPEQHKNGAWHFHGFLTDDFKYYFNTNEYGYIVINAFTDLGFHNIQLIENKERISSYVTKYVSKRLAEGVGKGNHSYFCSLGLNRSELIDDFVYNNEYFNYNFFNWHNEYCFKRIIKYDEYKNLKWGIDNLKKNITF